MQIEKDINKLADLFESNLLDTNRGYNYYIDWSNIDGYKKYEIEIHAMDVLIKKEDDTDPQMGYGGDGKYTPGINIGIKNIYVD